MQRSDVFRSKFICLKVKALLPNDRKYSINIIKTVARAIGI